jgi:hypothetical protein
MPMKSDCSVGHCVTTTFVPRILTADQKQLCINICYELHQVASDDETFLSGVITGDKSWIYSYDRDKATILPQEQMNSKVKSMLIICFDIKGIVDKEFILAGQTVHPTYYRDVLW